MLMIESSTHAKYLEFLDRQVDTLFSTRKAIDIANLAIYITECICRGQELYLNNNKNISKQDIINFDYEISEFADKLFIYIEEFLKKILSNRKSNDIGFDKLAELLDAKNKMLFISARWHTLRYMQVFDLSREPKKQKVPRRLPLLVEPCFCFDRVISTAMGIYHLDGFNPNRGVNCLPPSGGKTYTANAYSNILLMQFWIRFGETGLIRMTNNATNAQAYGDQCAKMIESDENIKIFPELNKYINSSGVLSIFKNKSIERLLLKDCNPECTDSIFMFGADAGINGKRSQLGAVLDDLSNGVDDMDNDELHKKITDKVMSDVMDRSDDEDCPIIVQGTMYNQFDSQNQFISMWESNGGLKKLSGHDFIRTTQNGKCFVCLVDIEDEYGNSIAPDLYTNEKLAEKKAYFTSRGKGYVYNLIYRQKRDSREPKTFALEYLNTYNWAKRSIGIGDYSYCMIDTTRKNGGDFFAMPIFRRVEKTGRYRLYDVIFKQKSLGIVNDEKNAFAKEICTKIIKENVVNCCVENNTSNTTSALLKSICNNAGYKSCKFRDRFTARKGKNSSKVVRILNMEETIKEYIEFPDPSTLPQSHPLRLFIQHICSWSSTDGQKKSNPDDAIDSVSMFCEEFIYRNAKKGTIKFVDKNFRNFL